MALLMFTALSYVNIWFIFVFEKTKTFKSVKNFLLRGFLVPFLEDLHL